MLGTNSGFRCSHCGEFWVDCDCGERTMFWCPECNQMLEAQPPGEEHSYMCAVEGCGEIMEPVKAKA